MKSLISGMILVVIGLFDSVLAGPYFNPEYNGEIYGKEFTGGMVNLDLGFENNGDRFSWFVQGGPAIVIPEDEGKELEFAAKFGGSFNLDSEGKYSIYGELTGITGDEFGLSSKLGAKFKF